MTPNPNPNPNPDADSIITPDGTPYPGPNGPGQLGEIAKEIHADWGDKLNYAARPYLEAMFQLRDLDDSYYNDSAESIVRYFLANAGSWRGETARRIKAQLRTMLEEHRRRS